MGSIHRKIRPHPILRARARSPAVGSAHSPTTPQALPCPQARNAPNSEDTPETPPPHSTATFPGPKGREASKARYGYGVGTA